MKLLARIAAAQQPKRDNETTGLSIYDWSKQFRPGSQVNYAGGPYQAFQISGGGYTPGSGYYETNSVVFACEAKRALVFSEARFQFQQLRGGRPGDLFGTPELQILEEPWTGATTRDLLVQAELDVACHGNSYWIPDGRVGPYLLRLDPNTVSVLTEAAVDPITGKRVGERLLGYVVKIDRDNVTIFDPTEIAHYKPLPNGANRFIGASWMSACLPDIDADQQMTEHKRTHLRRGANLGYVVSVDAAVTEEQFEWVVESYRREHEGAENSGKTLFLGGGSDVKTVGQSFADLAIKATQGAGETRIAACAGVHPVVVGLSEGMQGSSLNAGNYGAAKRNFVDSTMRPHWGAFAGAFRSILTVPPGARLWYDDRDIPFLREDIGDQAAVFATTMQGIRQGLDAGFEPDAVIEAAITNDFGRLLGQHSGLFSVQLQPAGSTQPPALEAP